LLFGLLVFWVGNATVINGAYCCAPGGLIVSDAFGAFVGVDHINGLALTDGLVYVALRLTGPTTDAIVGDLVRHSFGTSCNFFTNPSLELLILS
jgi:hypothetical protein